MEKMENIKLEIVKEKPKRGRPKKIIEQIIQEEAPIVQTIEEQVIKKRGRPRTKPLPDPNAPKKIRGRPKKVKPFEAKLNIEIPASKYLKQGFMKKEMSEMDKINMTETTQSILERAHKSGFQIRDLTKESPAFIANIPKGTFIKYITTPLNQFRIGGILRQVDDQLRYFSLYNPKMKSSWSVQIKNVKYLMFKSKKNMDEAEDD
jgi:hypothetical protein